MYLCFCVSMVLGLHGTLGHCPKSLQLLKSTFPQINFKFIPLVAIDQTLGYPWLIWALEGGGEVGSGGIPPSAFLRGCPRCRQLQNSTPPPPQVASQFHSIPDNWHEDLEQLPKAP